MYDRTGLSTKFILKDGFKNLRTGTEAKFRPFVDDVLALKLYEELPYKDQKVTVK